MFGGVGDRILIAVARAIIKQLLNGMLQSLNAVIRT
jgi:hypothetical protein